MRISEFITLLNTTKDTVRHYEELSLLNPIWKNNRREYGDKEVLDFQVIFELKSMGLSLKDIQLLFHLKETYGCGDRKLLHEVVDQLTTHLAELREEESRIHTRIELLEGEIENIKYHMSDERRGM